MKYTIEIIKKIIESKPELNLLLLDDIFINFYKSLKVICLLCNYEFKIYLNSIKNNKSCPKCSIKKRNNNNQKLTFEEVKKIIEVDNAHLNLEFIGKEFINYATTIPLRCKICDYIFNGYFGNIKRGLACYKCGRKNSAEKNRLSKDEVEKIINQFGFKWIDKIYIGAIKPLKLK